MIQYFIECLVFQLIFLGIYDLFLKRETFFQWNRAYLLGTFVLSLVLPWVRIEALKTTVSSELIFDSIFLWQLDEVIISSANKIGFFESLSPIYVLYGLGALLTALWFVYKLVLIFRLRQKSTKQYFTGYTKVLVKQSKTAFSFFKTIFLGDRISKEKEPNIIAHELVHIKQWHSLDLLFFELMRIFFWFNPLTYVYQSRVSELHEFIADSKIVKTNKKEHYQSLLSEAFQTQNISFINQFFKKSLIKKRIVMLQKQKSKAIWQLKYAILLPFIIGMLCYTSCAKEPAVETNSEIADSLVEKIEALNQDIESRKTLSEEEKKQFFKMTENIISKIDKSAKVVNRSEVDAGLVDSHISVPFAFVEEVPVFPGCEDAEDRKTCFQEMMQKHIRDHFNYPEEAQIEGIQGRVHTIFRISSDGDIVDIRTRGPHELLENEAVRILSKLPKMQSGKQKGKAVDVPFSIPIAFRLK